MAVARTKALRAQSSLLISLEELSGNGCYPNNSKYGRSLSCYSFPGALKIHLRNAIWEKHGGTGEKGKNPPVIIDCSPPLEQLLSEILSKNLLLTSVLNEPTEKPGMSLI